MNKIYIIGAGNMGSAIAEKLAKRYKIYLNDKNPAKLLALGAKINARVDKNFTYLPGANFLIIAVKPQDLADLAKILKPHLLPSVVLVSIVAGVTVKKLQRLFGINKVTRVMPNMGLLVGQGIGAWKADGLSQAEKGRVKKVLDDLLENFEVKDESLIDAVTAVSGSGPAYFFYLAQSLVAAARTLGLPAEMSKKLVVKTFLAAAELQKSEDYQDLIGKIASKKGTTEAALKEFKKHRLENIVAKAAKAAVNRAKELSNG